MEYITSTDILQIEELHFSVSEGFFLQILQKWSYGVIEKKIIMYTIRGTSCLSCQFVLQLVLVSYDYFCSKTYLWMTEAKCILQFFCITILLIHNLYFQSQVFKKHFIQLLQYCNGYKLLWIVRVKIFFDQKAHTCKKCFNFI